jgi:hypothetical protein
VKRKGVHQKDEANPTRLLGGLRVRGIGEIVHFAAHGVEPARSNEPGTQRGHCTELGVLFLQRNLALASGLESALRVCGSVTQRCNARHYLLIGHTLAQLFAFVARRFACVCRGRLRSMTSQ